MKHVDTLMQVGQYRLEDEAIIDALAVAAMLIQIDSHHYETHK